MNLLLLTAACFIPVALLVALYDIRWIQLALKAKQRPPWGAPLRLLALLLCHGGAFLLLFYAHTWPPQKLTFWLHMTFDPGLSFYAFGLWDLATRLQRRTPAR